MKNRIQQTIGVIKSLYTTTKQRLLLFVSGQFRKTEKTSRIDYNFNMKEYFTLEGKIEENRRFLRETQDRYEKIRGYYPLFFIYIGFIGFYTFDILQYFLRTEVNPTQLFLGILLFGHILVFGYVFYLMTKLFALKDMAIDPEPKLIYSDYNKKSVGVDENVEKKIIEDELKSYLLGLEEDNHENFKILDEKKTALSKVISYVIFSFILYICLITIYKISTMDNSNKSKESDNKNVVINNNTINNSTNSDKIERKPRQSLKDNREIDITKNIIDDKSDNKLRLITETKTPCEQIDSIAKANKCDEFNKKYNENSNYDPKIGRKE